MKLSFFATLALTLTPLCAHAVPVKLRVVDKLGQPVANALVQYASFFDITEEKPDVARSAQTGADGTLSLDLSGVSKRADGFTLQLNGQTVLGSARVRGKELGYGNVALVAGENTLSLQETSRVQGTIRDAKGAPLEGAQVKFVSAEKSEKDYSNMSAQGGLALIIATTKADGSWILEDLPHGYTRFSVTAAGNAKSELALWVDKAITGAPELKLRAAGTVRGRVVDFGGRALPSVNVFLRDDYSGFAESDAQGRFELAGVPVGESALSFTSSAPTWTGVSGAIKATIPAQNAIVDIGDVRADEGLLLSGMVVDDVTQAPIAGVKLKMFTNGAILQTDAQGRFEARVLKPYYGLDVLGDYTEKRVMAGGAQNGAKFDVGTIAVERIGATLRGRVVDEKGAPVPNARVGWNSKGQFNSSTPDANGNFEIKALPFKPLSVSASDGRRLTVATTLATATPNTPLTLKLAPVTAPLAGADIEKLWDELKIKSVSDLDRYFKALGARRVYGVARRLDTNLNPTQIGEGLSDYLRQRAYLARTPAERESVAREGTELLRRYKLNGFSSGLAQIAIAAARSHDPEVRDFAESWYDTQKTRVKPLDSPDKVEWYDIAQSAWVMQVGAALGRDDATKYRDIWLVQIDKPHNESSEQYLPEWGETLWRANPSWFDEIVGAWPAPQQMRAIVGALEVEANPARAKALLARLEKLASDPAVVAADAAKPNAVLSPSAQNLVRGRTNFARSMALVDAPAALDALDQVRKVVESGEVYEIAAMVARQAIAGGQSEIARRALKLGLSETYGGSGAPALALIAGQFDANLAAQLMEVARKNAMRNFRGIDPTGWSDVSGYTVALRDSDAGTGRLMLEDQWAKRQQTPQNNTFPDKEYQRRDLIVAQEKLAWAMAFYDVSRALQWLSEIKDDRDEWNNGLERTRLAILVAALTPPERRSFLLGATYFN